MGVSPEDREQAEDEFEKISDDPDYLREYYEEVTDEFLDGSVDRLLGDLEQGSLNRSQFLRRFNDLDKDQRQLFLNHLPDSFNTRKSA